MDKIAQLAQGIAYSEDDMRNLCEGKVNVMSYKEAVQLGSIARVLGHHGAAIVLVETEPNYGHWVALIDVGNGVLEWFDSYGMAPDSERKMVSPQFQRRSMQDAPYLTAMIHDGGYHRVIFNEYPLQSNKRDVSTCGRWAALRVCLREFPLAEFIGMFVGQKLRPDDYVSLLTLFNR